jgi:hypothetical protein
MKAHNISSKGAPLSGAGGAGGGAGGSSAAAGSPSGAKKPANKKRKVNPLSDEEDDELPDIKLEPKKEPKKESKKEKKAKTETMEDDDPDAGSFMLSDIPEAPPNPIKKRQSYGDGNCAGDYVDHEVCLDCGSEQTVKHEPGYGHTPLPSTHPSLDNGGAFTQPIASVAATQCFGYETNQDFQSFPLVQPQSLIMRVPSNQQSAGPSGVTWFRQAEQQHYFWDVVDDHSATGHGQL